MRPVLPGLSDVIVIKGPEEALVKNTANNGKQMIKQYLHPQPKDKTVGKIYSLEEN